MSAADAAAQPGEELFARQRHSVRAVVRAPAVWIFAVLVVAAATAPLIAPYGSTEVLGGQELLPPSQEHLFGTDANGMDVFSRVLFGAQVDLLLAVLAALLSALVGVPLGAIAGYAGGFADSAMQRVSETIQAFPVVLLAMAVLGALGASLGLVVIVIAIINIPVYFRLVRSIVLPWRQAEFVEAARLSGNDPVSIVVRHLLPNTVLPVVAQLPVTFAWAIQIIAGLSFLGLAVKVPDAEWGLMVQQGSQYVTTGEWWVAFFPGIAIFLAVLLLTRVGSAIQRAGGGLGA
ncbi:MAG: ABC transporter permease [Gaiellales bacterium]